MSYLIETEISRFAELMNRDSTSTIKLTKIADYAVLLTPKNQGAYHTLQEKDIALTVLGLIHGNEWAGTAVLNEVLDFILRGLWTLEVPVAFVLGNPAAAKDNRRFIDSDLNRSFGKSKPTTLEQRRASEISPILERTSFLLDLHQTREQSAQPFFIFPYTRKGFAFAHTISPHTPIVTHWGKSFSNDGMCTDEFTNKCGGTGITLELGRNGFDAYQIAAGFKACLHALDYASSKEQPSALNSMTAELYTWHKVFDYPEGNVILNPGFYNFMDIKTGTTLGTVNGEAIVCDADGKILFPSYPRADVSFKPAELCRIIKPITLADLP